VPAHLQTAYGAMHFPDILQSDMANLVWQQGLSRMMTALSSTESVTLFISAGLFIWFIL
jgi:hypothetical protein